MYTIKNYIEYELIVKNSKFITLLYQVKNKDEVESILIEVKKNYPKATHYTYAFITEDSKKMSDDGEPTGTAGAPILNVLEKNNMVNTLCIVVRYFGGIKLGAGGLIRAYSKAAREGLNSVEKIELLEALIVKIKTNYEDYNKLLYLLNNPEIIYKEYKEDVNIEIKIQEKDIKILDNNNIKYEVIGKTYINN